MNYTPPLLLSDDPDRIVPRDEGLARLAEIKASIEAIPEPETPASGEMIAEALAKFRKELSA